MPVVLPSSFTIGDSFSHSESLSSYPAGAGWALFARLVPRVTGNGIAITFAASGNDHVATVADTSTWVAGIYSVTMWVEQGATVTTVASGAIKLLPDPRIAVGTLDNRQSAQINLDNVRAALGGAASANVLRYKINGRELEHYSLTELITLESHLVLALKREQATAAREAGQTMRRQTYVRLGRA